MNKYLKNIAFSSNFSTFSDFFIPKPEFIHWFCENYKDKEFVDLGCGKALLGYELSQASMTGVCANI